MRRHRLDRLSKLAQGAAVISMGVLTAACDKTGGAKPEEPIHTNATAEPPHVNATATPTPTPTPTATPSGAPSAAVPATPATLNPSSVPHTVNAPPTPPTPKSSK